MRSRLLSLLVLSFGLVTALGADAQPSGKVRRVGFLSISPRD
jgi:hypothetical protein